MLAMRRLTMRDPRKNPRSGDVLQTSHEEPVIVVRVEGDCVIWTSHMEKSTLSGWCDWHGTPNASEVLHVAAEAREAAQPSAAADSNRSQYFTRERLAKASTVCANDH